MPIKKSNLIPVTVRSEGNATFDSSFVSVYNRYANTAPMTLTLDSSINFPDNAEIIIRNAASSSDDITLAANGFTIDVSADLGLLIPPGGIAELKRVNGTTTWDLYGFIAA